MRLTSLVAVTATLITAVSAGGRLGFSLGTKKPDGSCKTQQDYEDDFDAIKTNANSTLVRGYSASDCNVAQNILPAAKAKGVQVMLGVWCVCFSPVLFLFTCRAWTDLNVWARLVSRNFNCRRPRVFPRFVGSPVRRAPRRGPPP